MLHNQTSIFIIESYNTYNLNDAYHALYLYNEPYIRERTLKYDEQEIIKAAQEALEVIKSL
jgi:hypothetical protein